MKMIKKLLVSCLSLLMALSVFGVSFSTVNAEEAKDIKATIGKTLRIAEGVTTPEATFRFTFRKVTVDAAEISEKTVVFGKGDKDAGVTDKDGAKNEQIVKDSENIFANVVYPHAGLYEYIVSETPETYVAKDGVEEVKYDASQYKMLVLVKSTTNGLVIEKVGFRLIKDPGVPGGDKVPNTGTPDVQEYRLFTNTYIKKAGSVPVPPVNPGEEAPVNPNDPPKMDPNQSSLVVEKLVAGEYGDRTKTFTFSVILTQKSSVIDDLNPTYKAKIAETQKTFTFEIGKAQEVQLTHGQKLIFDNLPAGTKFSVNEVGTPDYVPSFTGQSNGTKVGSSAAKGQNLSTNELLAGEMTNAIHYTNTFDGVINTGILIDNLPYIMVFAVVAGAVVLYFADKKRKHAAK